MGCGRQSSGTVSEVDGSVKSDDVRAGAGKGLQAAFVDAPGDPVPLAGNAVEEEGGPHKWRSVAWALPGTLLAESMSPGGATESTTSASSCMPMLTVKFSP
jgi:hypothetical protein